MSPAQGKPSCFKAYDVRGRVPDELDEDLAYRIGLATATLIKGRRYVVGRDCRLTSADLAAAVSRGLNDAGAAVLDVGMCGTEQVYFTTFARQLAGGIMVTASHNPFDYNGMKLVRQGARPISGDSGLAEIGALTVSRDLPAAVSTPGKTAPEDTLAEYVDFLLDQIDPRAMTPLKIVVNAGNGCAGPVIDALAPALPFEFIRLHHEPDGHFLHSRVS